MHALAENTALPIGAPGIRHDVASPIDRAQADQATRTVTALQDALARGVPLMVPGSRGATRSTPPVVVYPALAAVYDRRRDEHEWEGGGSPDARGVPLPVTASWRRRLYRMLGLS